MSNITEIAIDSFFEKLMKEFERVRDSKLLLAESALDMKYTQHALKLKSEAEGLTDAMGITRYMLVNFKYNKD